mmetsp:Transcript_4271/g.6728  ORF Transcript_4271/g.6728 Transcript_4271/m.6728 type:complete len:132 (-) Transcript_4271:1376-1771(-)
MASEPASLEGYLKNLIDLKNADDEVAKRNKDVKDRLKSIKNEIKTHMEQKQLKYIPVGDSYLVLKRSAIKPTINDEFIVAVAKKYMDSANLTFQDQDAINFLHTLNQCREALTTYKTDVSLTTSKPLESLY